MFLSSHLMSEMALTAEHLIVVGRGRLIADMSVADLVARSTTSVRVRSPQSAALRGLLSGDDVTVTTRADGALEVTGLTTQQIGDRAAGAGLTVHELALQLASLEEAYLELTADAVEYHGHTPAADSPTTDSPTHTDTLVPNRKAA